MAVDWKNRGYLKRYKFILTTVGPVYVGSGQSARKTDYIIVDNGKKLFLPNIGKLYYCLNDNQKVTLENNARQEKPKFLGTLLRENGVSEVPDGCRGDGILVDISSYLQDVGSPTGAGVTNPGFKPAAGQTNGHNPGCSFNGMLPINTCPNCSQANLVDEESNNNVAGTTQSIADINWTISNDYRHGTDTSIFGQIFEFSLPQIDPLTSKPYIPGSSLKGALKNIFINKILNEQNWNGDFDKDDNNVFKGVSVSDSKVINSDSLILCSKYDEVALKGNFKELRKIDTKGKTGGPRPEPNPHPLNIARISIKPSTQIEFEVSVDTSDGKASEKFIENLEKAINQSYNALNQNYLSKFNHATNVGEGDNVIYIGGGVGFLQKTSYSSSFALNNPQKLQEMQNHLNNSFSGGNGDNRRAVNSRDHKNMGHWPERLVDNPGNRFINQEENKQKCSCNINHQERRAQTIDHQSQTVKVDDLQDFGACPRCLKLTKVNGGYLEMGKCKVEIQEVCNA